jgi:hypothetical protein
MLPEDGPMPKRPKTLSKAYASTPLFLMEPPTLTTLGQLRGLQGQKITMRQQSPAR